MSESSLDLFKVSYNFEIWIINTDSKSWSALSSVYFMTFYKLQNSLKSPLRMQKMAFQGLYISKFSRGSMPPDPLQVSRAFGARSPKQAKTPMLSYINTGGHFLFLKYNAMYHALIFDIVNRTTCLSVDIHRTESEVQQTIMH